MAEDMEKHMLNYQLKRHCSKTATNHFRYTVLLNYQLKRHCSKTFSAMPINRTELNYQLKRHCSKTNALSGFTLN